MSIREDLDAERDLTLYTVGQGLEFDELFAMLERVYARREYTTRSLFDLREARAGGLSAEQLRRLVGLIGERRRDRGSSRWAIVAPQDVLYGVSRMFEAYANDLPVEIRVFHDMQAARAWLDEEPAEGMRAETTSTRASTGKIPQMYTGSRGQKRAKSPASVIGRTPVSSRITLCTRHPAPRA